MDRNGSNALCVLASAVSFQPVLCLPCAYVNHMKVRWSMHPPPSTFRKGFMWHDAIPSHTLHRQLQLQMLPLNDGG